MEGFGAVLDSILDGVGAEASKVMELSPADALESGMAQHLVDNPGDHGFTKYPPFGGRSVDEFAQAFQGSGQATGQRAAGVDPASPAVTRATGVGRTDLTFQDLAKQSAREFAVDPATGRLKLSRVRQIFSPQLKKLDPESAKILRDKLQRFVGANASGQTVVGGSSASDIHVAQIAHDPRFQKLGKAARSFQTLAQTERNARFRLADRAGSIPGLANTDRREATVQLAAQRLREAAEPVRAAIAPATPPPAAAAAAQAPAQDPVAATTVAAGSDANLVTAMSRNRQLLAARRAAEATVLDATRTRIAGAVDAVDQTSQQVDQLRDGSGGGGNRLGGNFLPDADIRAPSNVTTTRGGRGGRGRGGGAQGDVAMELSTLGPQETHVVPASASPPAQVLAANGDEIPRLPPPVPTGTLVNVDSASPQIELQTLASPQEMRQQVTNPPSSAAGARAARGAQQVVQTLQDQGTLRLEDAVGNAGVDDIGGDRPVRDSVQGGSPGGADVREDLEVEEGERHSLLPRERFGRALNDVGEGITGRVSRLTTRAGDALTRAANRVRGGVRRLLQRSPAANLQRVHAELRQRFASAEPGVGNANANANAQQRPPPPVADASGVQPGRAMSSLERLGVAANVGLGGALIAQAVETPLIAAKNREFQQKEEKEREKTALAAAAIARSGAHGSASHRGTIWVGGIGDLAPANRPAITGAPQFTVAEAPHHGHGHGHYAGHSKSSRKRAAASRHAAVWSVARDPKRVRV